MAGPTSIVKCWADAVDAQLRQLELQPRPLTTKAQAPVGESLEIFRCRVHYQCGETILKGTNTMSEERPADSQGKIILFGAKQIRRAWVDGQCYFSVVDIVSALTDSDNPRNYWNMMKARELKQSQI